MTKRECMKQHEFAKKKKKSTKENNYFSQVKIKVIFKVVNDFVLFLLI